MVVLGFMPLAGRALRKACDCKWNVERCTSSSSHSRFRRRGHLAAVAQIPGENIASPFPNAVPDESPQQFTVISNVMETPGGWIVDADVTNYKKKTKHTVILGKKILEELCEGLEKRPSPGLVIEYVFDYFMSKGQNLTNTEGLLDVGTFPINYFGVRQLFYFFPDAKEVLSSKIAESVSVS